MAGFFGKFFGRTISEAAGFGIGSAIRKPLEPPLQELTNETWRAGVALGSTVPLEPADAAEIVAEDVELASWGADQAAQTGLGGEQFAALVRAVLAAPGVAELLTLWRRGFISQADFEHGLRKTKLETRWDTALEKLKDQPLPPAVAALAAVRGLIDDEGTLPVGPPTEHGVIPPFPRYTISGKKAAAALGLSEEAYAVMVGINGRPMSLHEAASAYFRQIIKRADYDLAVAEGDTRNEWRDAILEQAREILTAGEYVESHLRGWTDEATMLANTAKHGMSPEDTQRLFELHGRPIPVHQVTTGLARGGTYNGDASQIPEAYIRSLQQGNERPEWYSLSYANRYSYPSAFVLRALTQNGEVTEADAEQILLFEGWEPTLAAKVAKSWAGGTGQSVASEVKSARTKLLTKLHTLYVSGAATDAQAIAALQAESYDPAIIDGLLQVWGTEKALIQAVASNPPGPIT